MDLSAVILTFNEEKNVGECLASLGSTCEIFIVDSYSTDRTEEICRAYTGNFTKHKYRNHAMQWQWALDNLPINTNWILALDADFIVTDSLKLQLSERLNDLAENVDGIYVSHKYMFAGGKIRFGGTKSKWMRVVRKNRVKVDTSDLVDFRFKVKGKTVLWDGEIIESNAHDLDISTWLIKQDKFSLRLAVEEEMRRKNLLSWESKPKLYGNPDEKIMWLRDKWLNLPLFIRPVIYFLYRYIWCIGFIDGRSGFLYHFLQGFWLRTIVDWKTWQIREHRLTDSQLLEFRDLMLLSTSGSVEKIIEELNLNGQVKK